VLFFHQQIHFVEAVKSSSVFLGVILKRLLQSEERDTTLMLDCIAHVANAGRNEKQPAKEHAKIRRGDGLTKRLVNTFTG
jgi:hypothetical protein